MLQLVSLTKRFGGQSLFEDVTLQLNAPGCYGVVGANGSGKSTLLKIMTGEEPASDGEVQFKRRARVGVLAQDRFESLEQSVVDVAMMGDDDLWNARREREGLLARSEESDFDGEAYAAVEETFTALGGYTIEARAGAILEGLGIPTTMHRGPLRALSGGFQLRALLAQTLAAQPDILLLDEPTNHLDIVSIRWLEDFLVGFEGLCVVVSHDHLFLDRVCTNILDVDYDTVTLYPGAYTDFETSKAETRERQEKEGARREKEIAETRRFIERFKAKATKARQAQSRVKQLAKIEAKLNPLATSSRRYPRFVFAQERPSGREALAVENVHKAYGDAQVLEGVGFSVRRSERIAIVGANGVGKSTLLKALVGEIDVDQGTLEWGHEARFGYFPQDHKEALGQTGTVLSWLWDANPAETTAVIRGTLGRVLFEGDDVDKRVTDLSGGEAARLLFARLMLSKPNVLLLDEPTNHLDMESIEALTAALSEYEGTLLFVSHDRWFVQHLANRIIEITPGGVDDYQGTWDEFLDHQGEDHLDAEAVLAKQRDSASGRASGSAPGQASGGADDHRQKRKATVKERRRLERERDQSLAKIEAVEAQQATLEARFCEDGFFTSTPREEIDRLQAEQQALATSLEEAMAAWESAEANLESLD